MMPTQFLPRARATSSGMREEQLDVTFGAAAAEQATAAHPAAALILSAQPSQVPETAAFLYVEPFSEGFAPTRCAECCQRFRIGAPRLGYMPAAAGADGSSVVQRHPRWIHVRCVREAGLCLELGRQTVAFSPNTPARTLSG